MASTKRTETRRKNPNEYDTCPQCGGTKTVISKRCKLCARPGRSISHGYVQITAPGHPLASARGIVFEHRMVLYDAGLRFSSDWDVHHLNGNKQDNRLENLAVIHKSTHGALHVYERGYVTNQYGTFPVAPRTKDGGIPSCGIY